MNRIHIGSANAKYPSGKWTWDEKTDSLHFRQHEDLELAEVYRETNGFKFLRTLTPEQELVFRQEFTRSEATHDADTVLINDVRDLVLFLMPKEFLEEKFIDFMHKPAVHRLLHALIIYFEYFLRAVEFILIRRDELSGNMAQIQSEQTNTVKRLWSSYLTQYRMLVGRNYSVVIKGEGDLKRFYHTKEIVNISSSIKDRIFHERFLAVAIQIVWITMHRRAYDVIEMEMNRLFRTEHFKSGKKSCMQLSTVERTMLYGRNNKLTSFQYQVSPPIQDLINATHEEMAILWIGERLYRGDNRRIAQMELEYIVPGGQLHMIDVVHGILGHPKRLYNTLLSLDWPSVRFANFSMQNDPYHILRQPHLVIPNIEDSYLLKGSQRLEHYFNIFRIYEPASPQTLKAWLKRERTLEYYYKTGVHDTIVQCQMEVQGKVARHLVTDIVDEFMHLTKTKRKRMKPIEVKRTSDQMYEEKGVDKYFVH